MPGTHFATGWMGGPFLMHELYFIMLDISDSNLFIYIAPSIPDLFIDIKSLTPACLILNYAGTIAFQDLF